MHRGAVQGQQKYMFVQLEKLFYDRKQNKIRTDYEDIIVWDSLGPSPALALYHIAAQGIEFEKR